MVELSNDYLQLLILPEIGGKVWAAIDKTTGKPFIYFNHVVKFRDVSMRGPWTSGGIEANYGIIGHTPNCFSPVDYLVRRNPDGSASCIIGTLDLLTRTTWRLEINLPADQACFSTRSFWHNASPLDQPYYTWMNVGIKSAGNLQFIHPGTHYIGHDGSAHDWPIDPKSGRDLSWYENNNFGSYKSYHVLGRLADFFGGYWHDEDFGMAHCAAYGDKPGPQDLDLGPVPRGHDLGGPAHRYRRPIRRGPVRPAVQPGRQLQHADPLQARRVPALRHRHLDRALAAREGHQGLRQRQPLGRAQCHARGRRAW